VNGSSVTRYVSKEWTALILLPTVRAIAGMWVASLSWQSIIMDCSANCVTAVNVSVKDQLTLSSAVAIGSTIVSNCFFFVVDSQSYLLGQQLSLFVIPLVVIIGWTMGIPLGLLFDPSELVALYLASMCFLQGVTQSAIDSRFHLCVS